MCKAGRPKKFLSKAGHHMDIAMAFFHCAWSESRPYTNPYLCHVVTYPGMGRV